MSRSSVVSTPIPSVDTLGIGLSMMLWCTPSSSASDPRSEHRGLRMQDRGSNSKGSNIEHRATGIEHRASIIKP
eukprot:381290-Rhodomonas_salina.1